LLAEVAKQKQVPAESDDEDEDENQDSRASSVPMSYSFHTVKYLQAELKEKANTEHKHLKSLTSIPKER